MKLDDMTIGEIKELTKLFGGTQKVLPFSVGEQVFIRCVTHYQTGRIREIVGDFLVLEDAAWIADTGRFADALAKAEFNEVEPVKGTCRVNTGAIVDCFEWQGPLPKVQK